VHLGAGAHPVLKRPAEVVAEITLKLEKYIVREAHSCGIDLSSERVLELVGVDMQINAQGLAVWLKRIND
jgi:hypothetical protein